ncbi:MAG TPA: rhodanese-like domain-containing protein [Firmicutes bacterium]|nr:rhodanese-like domain-containing protein [Bacillota bacterium]
MIFLWNRLGKRNGDAEKMNYQKISPVEVKKRLDAGEKVFLLDVRTESEYTEEHIPKSLSIPLDQLEQKAGGLMPDKVIPIFVYCLSGRRSASGAGILVKLGYTNVYDMGAMKNWPGKMEAGGSNGA